MSTVPAGEASQVRSVRITLDLVPGSEPIAGSVRIGGGPSRSISGWIALVGAVQDAINGVRSGATPPDGDRRSE